MLIQQYSCLFYLPPWPNQTWRHDTSIAGWTRAMSIDNHELDSSTPSKKTAWSAAWIITPLRKYTTTYLYPRCPEFKEYKYARGSCSQSTNTHVDPVHRVHLRGSCSQCTPTRTLFTEYTYEDPVHRVHLRGSCSQSTPTRLLFTEYTYEAPVHPVHIRGSFSQSTRLLRSIAL